MEEFRDLMIFTLEEKVSQFGELFVKAHLHL